MPFEAFENENNHDAEQPKAGEVPGSETNGLDLSNERLLGIDMRGADLSRANLSQALIAGANFESANLANARLIGTTLAGANLQGVNFSGADLSGSRWISVDIEGADFSDAITVGAKSVGVKWTSSAVPPGNKPGPMLTPLVFMPLIVTGGVILSLILRWRYRQRG
jgi:uncharacterized protein YjbI with pentapeptide repeats